MDTISRSGIRDSINGDINLVKKIIRSGVDINARHDPFEWTLLGCACRNGWFDIVKYLLDEGADVNAVDNTNCAPLYEAAINGHMEIVEYLLSNGADKHHRNDFGSDARMIAETHNYIEVAEYIKSYDDMPTKGVNCDP
jgi:ankyrin repeat protein